MIGLLMTGEGGVNRSRLTRRKAGPNSDQCDVTMSLRFSSITASRSHVPIIGSRESPDGTFFNAKIDSGI